ncbi:MAG: hypothetical protein WBC04_06160 [Candidatus Acidiferrales bacterium]
MASGRYVTSAKPTPPPLLNGNSIVPEVLRFLVNRYVKPEHVAPLLVVLNGKTELQK